MLGDKTSKLGVLTAESRGINHINAQSSSDKTLNLDDKSTATLHLEVVTYIGQMSAELSTMARNSAMPLLSYFLDMSAAEARSTEGQLRDKLQLDLAPEDVPVEIPNA